MNKKKAAIIAVVVGMLVITGAFGAGMVMASSTSTRKSIAERLSERFNVRTEDVQKVFTEAQEERLQAMRDAFEERLAEAVKDGKITEAQKTTILKKEDQILAKQRELTNLQQELRDWADDNNVDLSVLGRGPGRGMRGPRGGGFGPGPGGW